MNLSNHFCPFATEGNQAHWELFFSQMERNSNKRHPNRMNLFYCTWWTSWKWLHQNIRKLIKDNEFVNLMNELELHTWTLFVDVVKILINSRVEDFKELEEKLLKSLQGIGAIMSIKVYFLHRHLEKSFRLSVVMWVMSKENDSIRNERALPGDGGTNEW